MRQVVCGNGPVGVGGIKFLTSNLQRGLVCSFGMSLGGDRAGDDRVCAVRDHDVRVDPESVDSLWVCVGDPLPIPIFERSVPRFSAGFRQVWWRFGVTTRLSTRAPLLAVPPPPRAHNRPTPAPGHRRQSSGSPFCSRDAQDGERVSARSDAGTSRSASLELGRRCLSLLVGRRTSQTMLARPPVCGCTERAWSRRVPAAHARRVHVAGWAHQSRGWWLARPSAVSVASERDQASATRAPQVSSQLPPAANLMLKIFFPPTHNCAKAATSWMPPRRPAPPCRPAPARRPASRGSARTAAGRAPARAPP